MFRVKFYSPLMGIFKPGFLDITFLLLLFSSLSPVLYFVIGSVLLYLWCLHRGLWGTCRWILAHIFIPESLVILASVTPVSQRENNITLYSALAGPAQNLSLGCLCTEIRSQSSWATSWRVSETCGCSHISEVGSRGWQCPHMVLFSSIKAPPWVFPTTL